MLYYDNTSCDRDTLRYIAAETPDGTSLHKFGFPSRQCLVISELCGHISRIYPGISDTHPGHLQTALDSKIVNDCISNVIRPGSQIDLQKQSERVERHNHRYIRILSYIIYCIYRPRPPRCVSVGDANLEAQGTSYMSDMDGYDTNCVPQHVSSVGTSLIVWSTWRIVHLCTDDVECMCRWCGMCVLMITTCVLIMSHMCADYVLRVCWLCHTCVLFMCSMYLMPEYFSMQFVS